MLKRIMLLAGFFIAYQAALTAHQRTRPSCRVWTSDCANAGINSTKRCRWFQRAAETDGCMH